MSARHNTPRKFISRFGRAGQNFERQPNGEEKVQQPKTGKNEKERLRKFLPYIQMMVEVGIAIWDHFFGGGGGAAGGGGSST